MVNHHSFINNWDKNTIANITIRETKVFLNLKDHLDELPNFKKYIEQNNDKAQLEDDKGNIYAFLNSFLLMKALCIQHLFFVKTY